MTNSTHIEESPITTFIIPSIGRKTLNRAIESIRAQTVNRCKIIVVFDRVVNEEVFNLEGCTVKHTDSIGEESSIAEHNSGGLVRNHGIGFVDTKFISFLDDDDIISVNYVQELICNQHCDIFNVGMLLTDKVLGYGRYITLPKNYKNPKFGDIGINFSISKDFVDRNKIKFINHEYEDYKFISECMKYSPIIAVSKSILYFAGV